MRDHSSGAAEDVPASTTLAGAAHLLFLSHAGIDSEAALRLARRLEESNEAQPHGLKVWIDKADLGAGSRWKDALQSALGNSTAFAVYVGSCGVVNWVWDEVSVALDRAHRESRYPLVPILAPGTTDADLPSFLSQYQSVRDTNQPEEFQKLLRAVLRLEPRAAVAAEREPFVGLQAYDSRRAHLFFGREQEIDDLITLLRQMPLVLVTGDSGSGKSSVVRAGLVPAFRGGRLGRSHEAGPDETIWHVIETRPGTDPFGRLADSVRACAERTGTRPIEASELADLVRTRQPDKVRDAVLSGAPKDPLRPSKVLLVVDQFEEFRTSPQAVAYVTALLRLATPGDDHIRVVLTMRRDYYYTCDSFPELRERLKNSTPSGRYLLRRMSSEGLHAAITKPLHLAGIDERDREDLARAVLKDVGDEPGELALLQMALWRTWSEAKGRGPDLVRAYNAIGRVEGALAQAAEGAFERLSPDEQQRAEPLFVRLVRPGEAGGATRRVARLQEFDAPTRALADKLSQEEHSRLLTIREHTVEIAHEQLATQWLRYQRWIANAPGDPEKDVAPDPRGDDLRLLQSLTAEAARWDAAPEIEKARYRVTGIDLELYEQLAMRRPAWLSDVESRFVADAAEADRAEKQRRENERAERERLLQEQRVAAERLADAERARAVEQTAAAAKSRRLAIAATAVAIAALIFGGVAIWFWQDARQQRLVANERATVAQVRALAGAARRFEDQAQTPEAIERAAALAIESLKLAKNAGLLIEPDAVETAHKALIRLPTRTVRHGARLQSLAFSPIDGRLATGGQDGVVKLWPADGKGEPVTLRHGAAVRAVAFSPVDGRLATVEVDGEVKLWPADGKGEPVTLRQDAAVLALAFSPVDGRLATVGVDGEVKLWPADGKGEPITLRQGGAVLALELPTGDNRSAVSDADYTTSFQASALTGRGRDSSLEIRTEARGDVTLLITAQLPALAFSPVDGRLAMVDRDGIVKLWPPDGKGEPVTLRQGAAVLALAFSKDGHLAMAGVDGMVRLWSVDDKDELVTFWYRDAISLDDLGPLAFSPIDGRLATSNFNSRPADNGVVKLWPANGKGEPVTLQHGDRASLPSDIIPALAFSPVDGRLATGSVDGVVKFWPADGKGEPVTLRHGAQVPALGFSNDGQLATGGADGVVKLWPADGKGEPVTLQHGTWIRALAFSPVDGRLATGGDDDPVKLWPADGKGEPAILRHGAGIWALRFSKDGQLVTGGQDGVVKLWPADGKGEPATLQHGAAVRALGFLKDGRLATGGQDGVVKLWPADGKGEPVTLQHGAAVLALGLLKDGRLATGGQDGAVKLWPADGRGEPVTLRHGLVVEALAFSKDGRLATAGGADDPVKLWPADGKGEPVTLHHGPWTRALAFSPVNGRLATGGVGDTVKLWLATEDQLVNALCQRAGRNLSRQEWDQYVGAGQPWQPSCRNWPEQALAQLEPDVQPADAFAARDYGRAAGAQQDLVKRLEGKADQPTLASALGQLSYYALFARDFVQAKDAAERALALDNSQRWIETNLAHALMFTGATEAARAHYLDNRGLDLGEGRRWEGEILADFQKFKEAGLSHPLMAEIEARFTEDATPAPAAGGTATDAR